MKTKKLTFKTSYLLYVSVLALMVACAALYVSTLLKKYENTMPEKYVENAFAELVSQAKEGTLWQQYFLPESNPGEYEAGINVENKYIALLTDSQPEYVRENGDYPEDEMYYSVECDGAKVASVKLKAKGPAVTKLAILSYREWNVEYVKPIVEKGNYTLLVPEDFTVKANNILLNAEEGKKNGKGEVEYTIKDVYFAPEFEIKDSNGTDVLYEISDKRVVAEYYYYKINLPDTVTVVVNGELIDGVSKEDNTTYYEIKELIKPEVILADYYGNTFSYEGGKDIPLTHKVITAESGCEVLVMGKEAAEKAVSVKENPEYEMLKDYVSDLPDLTLYNIAVLKDNVEVSVIEKDGRETVLDGNETEYSFTARDKFEDQVPAEVSAEVDVLSLAQKWSLFMSADLAFTEMSRYLIKDSYQYDAAVKYATGIDIKFISGHGFANPAFTDESVTNFVWISDNSFSVDIAFVKHMILRSGTRVDDPMNDRFYFVKYDDTDDGVNNPVWKVAGMKEIVDHAE